MLEVIEETASARGPAELQQILVRRSAAVGESLALAQRALDRIRQRFPQWKITAEASLGSPASEIVRRADEWKPDLIVVGSHGRSALGRFVLGSVSQKVVTEAHATVRIARGRIEVEDSAPRIVLGFDGSAAAEAAVRAVSLRKWPTGTELRVILVDEPLTPSLIGNLIPPIRHWVDESNDEEFDWARAIVERAAEELRAAGLKAVAQVGEGDPKRVLMEEAERWGADAIFIGSTGTGSRIGRFLLGSVSAAVAARAHCSVEVVRSNL
jgi:nucleotide-binding universal stress UspA family protein